MSRVQQAETTLSGCVKASAGLLPRSAYSLEAGEIGLPFEVREYDVEIDGRHGAKTTIRAPGEGLVRSVDSAEAREIRPICSWQRTARSATARR
jgi:hypothetical protein